MNLPTFATHRRTSSPLRAAEWVLHRAAIHLAMAQALGSHTTVAAVQDLVS